MPAQLLGPFDPDEWELFAAEALVKSGKFFATSWRRKVEDAFWVIVIGGHHEVTTAYRSSASVDTPLKGFKPDMEVVRPGDPFFLFVDEVNRGLNDAESGAV